MSDNENASQAEDSVETTDRNELRKRAAKKAETKDARDAAATVMAAAKDPSKYVYYVSAKPEKITFDIKVAGTDYSPAWDKDKKHLCWRIPTEVSDRFEMHSHFVSGRIIKAKE